VKFSIFHKSISVALSFLVLFASISITIEKHFCGDVLVDVAIFSEVEKCGMEAFETKQNTITKTPCCKDEIDVLEGIDELSKPSFEDLTTVEKQVLASFVISYYDLFTPSTTSENSFNEYSPPKLTQDRHTLYEVYLI